MVMGVCRRVLRHTQDAEDAFQATFLVLAQRAATLRDCTALAGFLHGTAYRLAVMAIRSAARRRKHERQTPVQPTNSPSGELLWREVQTLLDEEIARLPDAYRSVFVLCCLEGLSYAEAARRLGVKEVTVSSRLGGARKRLQMRLSRRGVDLTALLAATALTMESASAQSAALLARMSRAAISPAVAALAELASPVLTTGKAKLAAVFLLAASVLSGAGVWFLANSQRQQGHSLLALRAGGKMMQGAAKPQAANSTQAGKNESVEVRGVVVDPDGKPFAGAQVYLQARQRIGQFEPEPGFARVRVISEADARFHFRVARDPLWPSEGEETRFVQNLHKHAVVTAVAAGYGPAWATIRTNGEAGKLTLQLVKDDVPINGRMVDLEGKPIRGVRVRALFVMPLLGESLQPWLLTLAIKKGESHWRFEGEEIYAEAAGLAKAVVTDAEGRFQLRGIGRERVATLRLEGPTIETSDVLVRTRPGPTLEVPYSTGRYVYYGATFEHAAAPAVPIVGTVRDKDTGKPLAGIIIQAGSLRTATDKEGRYRLSGLPKSPGLIVRAFSGPGQSYVRLGKRIEPSVGLGPVRLDFELKRGVVIRGRVTDKATGQPVRAEVEYFLFSDNTAYVEGAGDTREGGPISTRTSEDGSYSLVGLPGRGVVAAKAWSARADRYIVAAGAERIQGANGDFAFSTYPYCLGATRFHSLKEINPAKNADSVVCDIALDPGKTVTGTVLGPDGKPLTGASVEGPSGIWARDRLKLKTARFTLTAINPNFPQNFPQWTFFFHKEKQLGAAVRLTGNEPKDFTVRLRPCATITGRIVDSDGRPRPGLALAGFLGVWQREPLAGWGGFWGVKTDRQGRFRITGLIPGLKWQAILIDEGDMFGPLLRNVTFQPGETKDLGDLRIKPAN
jgi:RNA polymerase sigma factor (sigma-70 family)